MAENYGGSTGVYKEINWRVIHNSIGWTVLIQVGPDWIKINHEEFYSQEVAEHYLVTCIDKIFPS